MTWVQRAAAQSGSDFIIGPLGAEIITYTILGVPCYSSTIMGPTNSKVPYIIWNF